MSTTILRAIEDGAAGLVVQADHQWTRKATALEFSAPLQSRLGLPLRIIGQVTYAAPHRFKLVLHDRSNNKASLVRLCARGSHVNRHSDGKAWCPGSHLHAWTFEHADRHAVEPWDPWAPEGWVEASRRPLTGDEMREVFESFCGMLGVDCDVREYWRNPPLMPSELFIKMPDGEEIP